MKSIFQKILIIASLIVPLSGAFASCVYDSFQGWKDCFVKDKLSNMRNSVDIEAFQRANFVERVVELDRRQPESTLTFTMYKKLIKLDDKIDNAKEFYLEHKGLLQQVAADYKVEPEIIVALVAMESDLGKRQGGYNVIDSLATLAYEGRRRSFFEKELINALTILSNEKIAYEDFVGSWAGAMGQCQFMPSSYLNYAIDYNQDGVRDIWASRDDVFASAANYLAENGWRLGHYIIKKATDKRLKCNSGQEICDYHNGLKLIRLKTADNMDSYYIVGDNFKVLMKWNRSLYFGTSVLLIANSIANK